MGEVLAVIGAQYGSEGKGVIVAAIADRYNVHVRVGGPNAGHSFQYKGKIWKQQALPCGWINPEADLIIGRGAIVDPALLNEEIMLAEEVGGIPVSNRIYVDNWATCLLPEHQAREGGVLGKLHLDIGSTGKGVGAARLDRMARGDFGYHMSVGEWTSLHKAKFMVDDTVNLLNGNIEDPLRNVLLEGTQGSGLSLTHGTWPYVTSSDTNAGQLSVDCGIAPRLISRTLLVARTFPIRVAGNSGPLHGETTWADLGQPEERTTVTRKVRRVGTWDNYLFYRAVELNKPTSVALTFLDYLEPSDTGKTRYGDLSEKSKGFIRSVEELAGAPVALCGTGGDGWQVIDRGYPL